MRKAIPVLFLVCVVVVAAFLTGDALQARAHGGDSKRVANAVERVTAQRRAQVHLPAPQLVRAPVQAYAPAVAAWQGKPGLEREFTAWADAHQLTEDQRQAINSAIADARANYALEYRARANELLPMPGLSAAELAARSDAWFRLRMGDTVAPELLAEVERVAGKRVADSFAEDFTGVLTIMLDDTPIP